ncbi:hypothetical protein Q3G72_001382 [Acer saccharum]|nr:hypothetical protein Q3G72_001382 [Acer saccharum]
MKFPLGMRYMHAAHFPPMGIGMGMGMGIDFEMVLGIKDVTAGFDDINKQYNRLASAIRSCPSVAVKSALDQTRQCCLGSAFGRLITSSCSAPLNFLSMSPCHLPIQKQPPTMHEKTTSNPKEEENKQARF